MSSFIEKVSNDPLTFESDPGEMAFAKPIMLVLAFLHFGMGYRAFDNLLVVGQNIFDAAALLFGFLIGAVFVLLAIAFFSWISAQSRVVIRDGIVHCYERRSRSAPWTLDKSVPASAFDALKTYRSWGGESDFSKRMTLQGPSHSIAFYGDRGTCSEEESYWSSDEIEMTEHVSRELGNLPITEGEDISTSGKMILTVFFLPLILADIVLVFFYWHMILDP